jgi:hypothetical protein
MKKTEAFYVGYFCIGSTFALHEIINERTREEDRHSYHWTAAPSIFVFLTVAYVKA